MAGEGDSTDAVATPRTRSSDDRRCREDACTRAHLPAGCAHLPAKGEHAADDARGSPMREPTSHEVARAATSPRTTTSTPTAATSGAEAAARTRTRARRDMLRGGPVRGIMLRKRGRPAGAWARRERGRAPRHQRCGERRRPAACAGCAGPAGGRARTASRGGRSRSGARGNLHGARAASGRSCAAGGREAALRARLAVDCPDRAVDCSRRGGGGG